jgi:roadblock/LC7 domain-containing protein
MSNTDYLLKMKGAIIAGEFTNDGKLTDHDMVSDATLTRDTPELAQAVAHCSAMASMMFGQLAEHFTRETGMKFTPQKGWSLNTGDYTIAVSNNNMVILETANTDPEEIAKVLGY